ncbi:hypothetical protein IYW40_11595 [Methylocystis sp. H4A]|uniref:hypothetical protein n=1 Tax=Methylocystis sp. H4A TaxID=2785788 RepID=UPI0018C2AC18|nr:hypothetical protein [Methylocystis sp. H4A]MBG0802117.1 hypothetical protein [Methylocystis sp. H4A]
MTAMKHERRRRNYEGRFVAVPLALIETDAWRGLSGTAAKAWVSVCALYAGSNNGFIAVSSRALGERIGCHYTTAAAALLELENAGFLRRVKASSFSQRRLAAEYRLTHRPNDVTGEGPTHEYKRPKLAADNVVSLPAKGA